MSVHAQEHMYSIHTANAAEYSTFEDRMWDMSRFVMIVFLSLHRGETLSFSAYKLLVTHLSRDSSSYSGVYERRIRV